MNTGAYSPLDSSVLVLNKMYMAVHVVSVRRAFCLLCKEMAEVISMEEGTFATYDFSTWAELSALRCEAAPQGRGRLGPHGHRPRFKHRG